MFKQFAKFGLVGAMNTVLTYIIYLSLYHLINPTAAMGVGYGLTSMLGIVLNDRLVFKSHQAQHAETVLKYYFTYGMTLVLSLILTTVWNEWWQLPQALAPAFSLMVTVPTNFTLSKFWIFKTNKDVVNGDKTSKA